MGDRYIIVDDNDSGILYSGQWGLIDGTPRDKDGNFGPTYRGTLHSTVASQASFSYNYRGSAGRVTGSINVRTSNGVTNPSWECKVDGRVIAQEKPFPYFENNWDLCKWTSADVSDGQHTVEVSVRSNGQAFLFDRFQYVPSPSANVQNAVVSLHFNDPAINYGSGWGPLGDIGRMAADGGAVARIQFYGTGVTWIGATPVELPAGASTAQYQIDDNPPVTFTIPGRGDQTEYHVLMFETGTVARGHHTLTVTSTGRTSQVPLVLTRLWVRGGSSTEPVRPPVNGGGGGGGDGGNSGGGNTGGTTGGGSTGGGNGGGNSGSVGGDTPNTGGTGNAGSGNNNNNNNGSGGGNGSSGSSLTPSPAGSSPTPQPSRITITTFGDDGSAQITSIPNPSAGLSASGNNNAGGNNLPAYIDASEKNSTPLGAIIGGALGGLALIALMLIAFLWHKRQMRKRNDERQPVVVADPIQPFNASAGPGGNNADPFADTQYVYPQSTGATGGSVFSPEAQHYTGSGSNASPEMQQYSGVGAAFLAGNAGGLSPNRRPEDGPQPSAPYYGVIPPSKLSSQRSGPGHSQQPSQTSSYPGGSYYPQSGATSPINSMYTGSHSQQGAGGMSNFSPSESGVSSQAARSDVGPLVMHNAPREGRSVPLTKAQEAEQDRLAAQAELGGPSTAGLSRSATNGTRVTSYHHEDSGYRLPPQAQESPSVVVEHPPSYTPA